VKMLHPMWHLIMHEPISIKRGVHSWSTLNRVGVDWVARICFRFSEECHHPGSVRVSEEDVQG